MSSATSLQSTRRRNGHYGWGVITSKNCLGNREQVMTGLEKPLGAGFLVSEGVVPRGQ